MRRGGAGKRRDANEPEIIEALESIGVMALQLSGAGTPDLLCYGRGRWVPIEVKMPGEYLTPAQQRLYGRAPFAIVTNVADALDLFRYAQDAMVNDKAAAELIEHPYCYLLVREGDLHCLAAGIVPSSLKIGARRLLQPLEAVLAERAIQPPPARQGKRGNGKP